MKRFPQGIIWEPPFWKESVISEGLHRENCKKVCQKRGRAEEICNVLAENGLNLTEDELNTVLEELGKSVKEILAELDELSGDALDDNSEGVAMWTLAFGTATFKASGTLAVVLGGATGVALGVGAVALGIWGV